VSEPLAIGEGPSTWQAYFNQQTRWAFGCMDILRWHTPRLVREMHRRQALLYIALQQHYFAGLAAGLGLLLLVGYFAFGYAPAHVGLIEMLLWVTPLVIARQLLAWWLQRFNPDPENDRGLHLSGRYTSVVTWPIYLLAAIGVLRQQRLVFKVTPKGDSQTDVTPFSVIAPHAVIAATAGGCLVSALFTHRLSIPMLFWAACTCLLMLSFVTIVLVSRVVDARTTAPSPATTPPIASSHPAEVRASVWLGSPVLEHAHPVDDHLLGPHGAR
jgi:hypothetical protein